VINPAFNGNDSLTLNIVREYRGFARRYAGLAPNMLTIHPERYDQLRQETVINWTAADRVFRLSTFHGMDVFVSYDVDTFRVSLGLPREV